MKRPHAPAGGPIVVCAEDRAHSVPYVDALRAVGVAAGRIRVVVPEDRGPAARDLAAGAAGLVVCGGPDVEPWRYGEPPQPDADLDLYPELDLLEWDLLAGARQGRTPTWAICRGMQTINVFLGGSLWQDLPTQVGLTVNHNIRLPKDALAHEVEVVSHRERIGELLTRDRAWVNSRHHQAIKAFGPGLTEVARSADGVVEVVALESEDWWVRGVQWHPENLIHVSLQRALWSEFAAAADGGPNGDRGAR